MTTDCKFLLQLWDKLAPQVQDTLNLLRPLWINPNVSAYEALNGAYNWDCYPLAPPGCKAVIYKAPAVCGSWASRGTDAWYLGPSADHYRCNIYYVPVMQAYRISGWAKLFPQHCQVPNLSNNAHLKALTKELQTSTGIVLQIHKVRNLIKCLRDALDVILTPQTCVEQRVTKSNSNEVPLVESENPLPITQISDAPEIMQMRDPTAKRNLSKTKWTHWQQTQNNTPGAVPAIQRIAPTLIPLDECRLMTEKQCSQQICTMASPTIILPPGLVPGGIRASAQLASQQALIVMTTREALHPLAAFTPRHFIQKS